MNDNNKLIGVIENITKQLEDFYNGNSWVTDKLGKNIFSLTPSVAFKNADGYSHSVAQQLMHINSWRNFGVQKLTGNDQFNIEDNSTEDWPEPLNWSAIKNKFETTHESLVAAIKNFPIEKWNSNVPLRPYSFLYLINGIIQHDYYHFGQINSLLASVKKGSR